MLRLFFIMLSLEDLNVSNIKVYQDDDLYHFTSDAVLLAKFTQVKKKDVVADFCSGSGVVGFYLYGLNPEISSVDFFEMQTPLYELSKKSIELNGLGEKFTAHNLKVQDAYKQFNEKFSLIVCNPPYMKTGAGLMDEREHIAMCKNEVYLPLKELIFAISRSLKFGGRVNLVHRADRLIEVVYEMKLNNIEPKRLQFVCGGDKEPYLFLIEGVKGGKSGIKILSEIKN